MSIVCRDLNGDVGFLGGQRSNRRPTKQGTALPGFFKLVPANLDPLARCGLDTFR